MGREGFEPSKLKSSHFECDAYANFAIYPIMNIYYHKNNIFQLNFENNNIIMFINLLSITFFNDYIISPKTWLHYTRDKQKFFFIFSYLCFFYYYHSLYSIFGFIFCLIIIATLKVPLQKITSKFYFFIYYIICLFNIMTKVYKLKSLAIVIVKFSGISIISHLYLKILFLTTKYENTLLYILKITKNTISVGRQTILIITISTQFFFIITQKIFQVMFCIQLRNMNKICITECINIFHLGILELLIFSKINISKISYILYVKKIRNSDLKIKSNL